MATARQRHRPSSSIRKRQRIVNLLAISISILPHSPSAFPLSPSCSNSSLIQLNPPPSLPPPQFTSAMENQKISDFLAEQLQQAPEQCQAFFLSFEDYWERKLWHQLTNALIDFFRLPESAPQRLPIFKTFVLSFAERINQLKFVSLGLMASTQCAGSLPPISRCKSLS